MKDSAKTSKLWGYTRAGIICVRSESPTSALVGDSLTHLIMIKKKLLVFTGGGLAPALNPTIYGVLAAAREQGWSVLGGIAGWASLLPNGKIVNLDSINSELIRNRGGTILRSSRTNPFVTKDGPEQVKERLRERTIDAVIAIGGDDTLGAAARLAKGGFPIVGIPKTIDNDFAGSYFTPGFPTAASYLAHFTREIRDDAAYALSRIFIIESFGMNAGWLSVAGGSFGGADVIIPPEHPVNTTQVLELVGARYRANGNFAVVVVSQEARFDEAFDSILEFQRGDQYGHLRQSFVCLPLKELIMKEIGVDAKALYPGNWLETGSPIPIDRDLGIALGQKAVALVTSGSWGQMAGIMRPDKTTLELAVQATSLLTMSPEQWQRKLPDEWFDYAKLQPTAAFFNYMEPILGRPENQTDRDYHQLLKMIASQAG